MLRYTFEGNRRALVSKAVRIPLQVTQRTALGVEGRAFPVCPGLLTPSSPQVAGELCSGALGPGVHCLRADHRVGVPGQMPTEGRCARCRAGRSLCGWTLRCRSRSQSGQWGCPASTSLCRGARRRLAEPGLWAGQEAGRPRSQEGCGGGPSSPTCLLWLHSQPVGTLLLSLSWGLEGQDALLPGSWSWSTATATLPGA